MITMYDVALAKEDLDVEQLIYFSIFKRDFIFRKISLKEYIQCKVLTNTQEEFNDAICQVALVLSSENDFSFANSPLANISDICAPYIIEQSYINNSQKVLDTLEEERTRNAQFIEQCILLIKAAFPEFPIDEISCWTYDKLMKYVAKAEYLLTLKLGKEIKFEFEIKDNPTDTIQYSDKELLDKGIDLVLYYGKDINFINNDIIDYPIVMGNNWNDDEVIYNVRRQIHKGQADRNK